MLKFLKMMVAEDVTITDAAVAVEDVVLLQDAKEALLQDVKVLVVADSEATETQLLEKVASEATEIHLLLKEKVVSEVLLQELKEVQTEPQDVLKALVIHQDQEDQEEINYLIFLKYKNPEFHINWNSGFFLF